jgi:hypothetical protein
MSSLPFTDSGSATLGDVNAINYHSKPHTLHVLVEESSEVVHWSSHHLNPVEGKGTLATLENTWGNNDQQDTLYARRNNETNWKQTDLSNFSEEATFDIDIGIQEDKDITFSMSPVHNTETT